MLKIENLSVKQGGFLLDQINFSVKQGDYFVLLGPSGSGKSILLETLAGIIKPDSGKILLNTNDITALPTGKRNIGLVFQDNTIFPHLSVKKNLLYALNLQHTLRKERDEKMHELSVQLFLEELLDRSPKGLSGGELQRVLLARTLAAEPEILLLDEPLSSVDTMQKDTLKDLLRSLNRRGQTILHVTHDYEEAISLASHVGVLHKGKLLDAGTSDKVFSNPRNEFIARFCGMKNFFSARIVANHKIIVGEKLEMEKSASLAASGKCNVIINSQKLIMHKHKPSGVKPNVFEASVLHAAPYRGHLEYLIDAGIKLSVLIPKLEFDNNDVLHDDEIIWLEIPPAAIRIVD